MLPIEAYADFIVVGAGSAGCVVAARMVERGATVILVEAGKRERVGLTRLPAALMHTIGNARYDWKFRSEPDPTRNGSTEDWPRGRVPGGSSAINGMIFIRGAAADFDDWEALGNADWGWQSVLPYFRRSETADAHHDNATRGGLGPQRVSALRWQHTAARAFVESCVASGIPFNADLNGPSHDGVAWNQGSTANGLRLSTWDAYIEPLLRNPRMRIIDDALVERIQFEGKTASGIVASRSGQPMRLSAKRGVILSAGAINSPQLLMLSGIGQSSTLDKLGIETLIDSPEVGLNLMEHPGLHAQAELNIPTANRAATPLGAARAFGQWLFARGGPMSVPTAQAIAFFKSTADQDRSDLQFHIFPYGSTLRNGKREFPRRDLVTILVNASYPKSRGWLELKSADPREPIAIHPRLLDHPDDLDAVLHGLTWVRRIASTPPFGSHVINLLGVPRSEEGRTADEAFVRTATRPFYHPAGTCRMGGDEKAVVTPALAVRGAKRLWVADVSIFPRHIAGNTNATAIMIGERAADLIQAE